MDTAVTQVLDQAPATVPAGAMLVSFRRKDTRKNPVPEAEKFRCVVVPALDWSITAQPENATGIFAAAIAEQIDSAASAVLLDAWIAGGKAQTVPVGLFTLSALLAKMEQVQSAVRLDGDDIIAWYDASATKHAAVERYRDRPENVKKLGAKLRGLASNNPAISPELATKLISFFADADLQHPICKNLLRRLERLSKPQDTADDL